MAIDQERPSAEMLDWERRLRVAAAESRRRRARRTAQRADLARRRAHGLVDRRAARIALFDPTRPDTPGVP